MDTFGTKDLRLLLGENEGPCVSIYMPTHASGKEGEQDAIRLRNLLGKAEERLSLDWMPAPDARKLLKRARGLSNVAAFGKNRSNGLAIFISPSTFQRYRLPQAFTELDVVSRRFHVKPLLPALSVGERFFILALSQNKVRFFEASRETIEEISVPNLPANMEAALNYSGADRGSQVHSAMRGSLGKQAAVFHGQGGEADTRKEELVEFFRLVDGSLQPVLRDETAPLLLAGVQYLLPIYREVNSYPHLAKEESVGNCDRLSAKRIHQRAWPIVAPLFHLEREVAAAKFLRLAGTGKASANLQEILPAAQEGRVESLFVDVHALQWGRFDPNSSAVEFHEAPQSRDDDLLDLAAAKTLLSRGAVYAVERGQVPGGDMAAAVFRY
jgi:hypothetical protein